MKKGYIYITSSGYDPEKGKHLNDPYLGRVPTLGACMPNIRRNVVPGDYIYVISGKLPPRDNQVEIPQYIVAGFEVREKIHALQAYDRFPQHRLHRRGDGQLDGNVVVTGSGIQHPLDPHAMATFGKRVDNYVVGGSPLILETSPEVEYGRADTMPVLRSLLGKQGPTPISVVGRWSKLDSGQLEELNQWLRSIKETVRRESRAL